jgi:hypothetical protein
VGNATDNYHEKQASIHILNLFIEIALGMLREVQNAKANSDQKSRRSEQPKIDAANDIE